MTSRFVVYWLHGDQCICPWRHGYIGVTSNPSRRFWAHRRESRFLVFKTSVLFDGTREECYALEARLRPHPDIGWNTGVGGFADGRTVRGLPKSTEHRAKQRATALRRWADPTKRSVQSVAVKKALADVDRSGANNANFGKHCSEATKQKIRDKIAARGGVKGANNPNWKGGRPAH
jgi:hypothetical protein